MYRNYTSSTCILPLSVTIIVEPHHPAYLIDQFVESIPNQHFCLSNYKNLLLCGSQNVKNPRTWIYTQILGKALYFKHFHTINYVF